MTPQELKNSILQLAIQGKLVEQRPEEGTAEDLYKQIQAEKQALIKAGKLKKEKPLPEITEDEKPFEIPESWKWVRIANTWDVLNGDRGKNYPAKTTLSHKGIPFISALNLNGKTIIYDDNLLCLSEEQYNKLGNGKLIQGDIVVCIRGSLGKHGRFPLERGAIASSLVIMRSHLSIPALDDFLMLFLDSPLFFGEIKRYDNGTAQPNLAARSLELFLFPLPPLAEQKRIVARIEELLPLIDRYEQAWNRLEDLNKRFPMDLQKSVLQLAIQGKLTDQRPEEGTGEELYKQIQAEKQALIKAGKLKKEKPLTEITEDETELEIPDSWSLCKLGAIARTITDGEHKTPRRVSEFCGYYLLSARNVRDGYIPLQDVDYVDKEEYDAIAKRCNPKQGDVLISCSGSVGRCAVVNDSSNIVMVRSAAMVSPVLVDSAYLMYSIRSEYIQGQIRNRTKQTAQANLFQDAIRNLVVPLPPLAEQKRIVSKLEELLPLCKKLK